MIFVHDKGRMANNILQYGHFYAWGREHGRVTMSMRFAYKYPWFHIGDTPHHNFPTYVLAKYAAKWGLIPTVRFEEEDGDYRREEQLMLSRRMVVATGWNARWYDLFLKYRDDLPSWRLCPLLRRALLLQRRAVRGCYPPVLSFAPCGACHGLRLWQRP